MDSCISVVSALTLLTNG